MKREPTVITDFTLFYDGIYEIEFKYKEKTRNEIFSIPPTVLLKMLEIEEIKDMKDVDFFDKIHFEKVAITIDAFFSESGEFEGFHTSDIAELWQDREIYLLNMDNTDCISERSNL